ncbi:MAG TPA: hypothetical protein VFU81_09425, partial [Thermomicrobiales bacterium]|nr:hypothetical protein [Thermomicrobiales bacterium]
MELRPFTSLGSRLVGFLRFDSAVWRDLQIDPNGLAQALAVIIVASVAAAIGAVDSFDLRA